MEEKETKQLLNDILNLLPEMNEDFVYESGRKSDRVKLREELKLLRNKLIIQLANYYLKSGRTKKPL